jgi:ferredoxin--NADP+ reductase
VAKPVVYNATIVCRNDLTDTLAIFQIAADQPPRMHPWFRPGQYCVLGLNNDETPALGPVQRPMSIVSAPEAEGPIEFYIRRVARPRSPNPLTSLLWKLGAGDRIHLRAAAAGLFTIADTIGAADGRLLVMVAAGTGLAPYISMIRSEVSRNPDVDLEKWVVLHGASYPVELGYREELLKLCSTNHLQYWGTVSRLAPGWSGDCGRVETFFEPDRLSELESRLGLPQYGFTPENVVVFVCGLTGTIHETVTRLVDRAFVPSVENVRTALGVPAGIPSSVYVEDYDPDEPVIEVDDPRVMEPLRTRMQAALVAVPSTARDRHRWHERCS